MKKIGLVIFISFSLLLTGCNPLESLQLKKEIIIEVEEVKEKPIPESHSLALEKAEMYSDVLHMSKIAIYEQLISDDGERFYEDAAEYAVESIEVEWRYNALKVAELYADELSITEIFEKLTSEDGFKFTKEEADYAIGNLR